MPFTLGHDGEEYTQAFRHMTFVRIKRNINDKNDKNINTNESRYIVGIFILNISYTYTTTDKFQNQDTELRYHDNNCFHVYNIFLFCLEHNHHTESYKCCLNQIPKY